jgi:hypothetical protein
VVVTNGASVWSEKWGVGDEGSLYYIGNGARSGDNALFMGSKISVVSYLGHNCTKGPI